MTNVKEYSVRLEGVDADDLAAAVLRDLCDFLVEGAQRSARLAVEGRSVVRGTPPIWVNAVADVRVGQYSKGSVILHVRAPSFHAAAPELFAQQTMFGVGPEPDATAMDLLLEATTDAMDGRRESERLDAGVLELLLRSGQLFSRGGARLTISTEGRAVVAVDPESLHTIRLLSDETPAPRVTRVRGVLDAVTWSTRTTVLRLEDGRALRGYAAGVDLEVIRPLIGCDVVLEGVTAFKPSGDALRIDIDSAVRAGARDAIWAKLPFVAPASARPKLTNVNDGLAALFGAWPGDESDEELAAAMAELG